MNTHTPLIAYSLLAASILSGTAHAALPSYIFTDLGTLGGTCSVANQRVHFDQGETLHTENSYKFRHDEFSVIAERAGWYRTGEWEQDGFAVQLYG
jgi:hypothetical protein